MNVCLTCPCYNIVDYDKGEFIYDCTADEWDMEYVCMNIHENDRDDDELFECQVFSP